jgi:hypothetical protein
MRNLEIITNAVMTIRHKPKDKRNMKITRLSPLSTLLIAASALLFATGARAAVVDLINGDSGTLVGSPGGTAIFEFTQPQPTGTGYIKPFLRLQNDPSEQGYNTSGVTPAAPFDDKAGIWTHDLTFADLMTTAVTINGANYFKLLLDVNEPNGSKANITLTDLRFYTSSQGSLVTTDISQLGTLRWAMTPGDQVLLDASRNHGSGSGDMFAYIPVSAFAGTSSSDFVYMYCAFGNTDFESQGGFEEWSLVVNPIPEAGTLFPIIGLLAAVFSTQFVRRRQLAQVSK